MNSLNLKEITAIELKYLGNSNKKIAGKIEMPFDTVNGWFKSNGKLFFFYKEYSDKINQQREKNFVKNISVSDREFFILTTNIVRQFSKRLQKRIVPLVNKKGEAVADDDGNQIFVEIEPDIKFTVRDLKIAWEIQRIMRGLPTKYERPLNENNNFEAGRVIKEMGLSGEDFKDENLEKTRKNIIEYLMSK